jgi:hypothetical protein
VKENIPLSVCIRVKIVDLADPNYKNQVHFKRLIALPVSKGLNTSERRSYRQARYVGLR